MNVSVRWLRDMVPGLKLSPREIADRLALRGAPVESIAAPGEGLGDVVVGRVLTREQHPNADRLSVCTVDGGEGEVRVVCGAPNVRAGALYPFAPIGAVLPGGFEIKKAKIRGEVSHGMLCSVKELGLGSDHGGILEIEGDLEPGQSLVEALGLDDATLEVEVTANRGDLLSHVGLARELAPDGRGEVAFPELPGDPDADFSYEEGAPEVEAGAVSVRIDDPDLCPRYLGAVVRGVQVGPSPEWLQRRLRGAGARPINNVVDATNYVMLELGQPLHAFDLARLGGSAIVVRRAQKGEKTFTTLDEEERKLTSDMLMICDAEKPVAVAGVMGGLHSEVDEGTTDILLECALFEPRSIRATRKTLGMSTDASYRFERGVDPEGMRRATERCVAIILATAGGELDGPVLDCRPTTFEPQVVPLRLARIERLLGVAFDAESVRGLLTPLGFEMVGEADGALQVRVPGFRSYDVRREVDLIEEVARTYGFDAFPADLGPYPTGTVPDHPLYQLEDELRHALVARGLFEAHTPAFAPAGEGDVEVSNPLSTTEAFLRRSLAPALLRRVEYNLARGNRDVRLFEIGTSFRKAGSGEPPHEETHVAGVLTGLRAPSHWSRPDEPYEVWDLKSLLEEVAERTWRGAARVEPGCPDGAPLDPSASFRVVVSEGRQVADELGASLRVVGYGGRVADGVVDAPVWAEDVWALEVALPAEVAARASVAYARPPSHPPVDRDLALVVPQGVEAGTLSAVLREAAGPLLERLELFDVYVGAGIPEGTRSLAFRLRFRAPERTLKDQEVDQAVRAALERLEEELGVQPRG
ncbi:MAG TPA: phenylalanine--tRNA ligase subunit beta [Longimicrobiales bacterium]|nr:phenylalanine--tRNA ligase subunit beta [Longimicrobiales bacterium]